VTRKALISQKEMNQLATLATAKNVQVELERAGTIIRVSPHQPQPTIDDSRDAALDRELEAFKATHGYS
jgi:hypothetical protein